MSKLGANILLVSIVLCVKKQNNLWVRHFTTLSGHFLANYTNIFLKIELQAIILMCLTCLNLICIKQKTHFFICVFCNFVKKGTENLWLINGHLGTISGHFLAHNMKIFHKKEAQTVILRCLVYLNLNLIKSYDIILGRLFFFACLKMHYFRDIWPMWVLVPPKETSSQIFKIAIFPK